MYSYSDIASMTIQELIDNHIQLNEELISCIFKKPVIRDLPKLASLYGFYSRFIVGQTKVFFAYGTDPGVINGPFHEAEETVIPEYVVRKCGYFVSWNTNLLCPRCEVFEIPEKDTTRTYALSNRMMLLERTFHQNGKGVYIRKDNWEDRIINSVLQGSQWYHPIDELLKNGTMVDNKNPMLKQQTRQSSAEKKPAKKLSFKNLFN